MDPNVLSIFLGLITNGLTSLMAQSGNKIEELLIGEEFLEKWELEKTSLEPILHKAVVSVSETVEWEGRPAREEVVCLYLLSPDVEEIVRQIYSTRFAGGKKRDDFTSIRKIFLTLFTQFVTSYHAERVLTEDQLAESANFLLDTLINECEFVLDYATNKGILAAHEAKSAFRHNVIHSEIKAIQKRLNFLIAQQQTDIQAILDFDKQYRSQVGIRNSAITPPNFDSAHKLPIDDLFVNPKFRTTPKKNEQSQKLNMDEFLSRIYRAVLLGNPGGGKSTLSLKLCHDLAMHYSERLFAGRKQLTPILVVLREYGVDKKDRNCSILEFIEGEAKATYQLTTPPPRTFEYLLLNGKAMVFFDGLDELLDTSYRQEIRSNVESFCHLYPSVPVLVTSRAIGYEQAPLDEKMFEVFRLAEFDDEQVEDYVKKWFEVADSDETPKQRQSKVEAFLKESTVVPDLRSNPLMLALLCNIYKGENYIPRNRPDVYDKCAIMLFERWDKSRKLYAPPLLEEHIRPLMEFLAQWIYQDEMLRKGVTEEELVAKATEYLHEWVFEDIRKAERVAVEFIQFCTGGRAWVFLDTGTKKEGEKLYQFAHRTFLEYFTAASLVGTCRYPDALIALLLPRIAKREWDVMAQLAFQLQSKRMPGAGDELITALIDQSFEQESDEHWNLLSFAVRCLKFIVPRPKVTRNVVEECIRRSLIWGLKQKEKKTEYSEKVAEPREIISALLITVTSSSEIIADSLERQLTERINTGTESEALLSLEIGWHLNSFYGFDTDEQGEYHPDLWKRLSERINDSCSERITLLSSKYVEVGYELIRRHEVSIEKFIKQYGLVGIFNSYGLNTFEATVNFFLCEIYTFLTISNLNSEEKIIEIEKQTYFNSLKEIGQILLGTPVPWTRKVSPEIDLLPIFHQRKFLENQWVGIDSDVLFGLFGTLAVELESKSNKELINLLEEDTLNKFPIPFDRILIARYTQVMDDEIETQMNKCGFSSKQRGFIWQWIRGEIHLVKPTKRRNSKRHLESPE